MIVSDWATREDAAKMVLRLPKATRGGSDHGRLTLAMERRLRLFVAALFRRGRYGDAHWEFAPKLVEVADRLDGDAIDWSAFDDWVASLLPPRFHLNSTNVKHLIHRFVRSGVAPRLEDRPLRWMCPLVIYRSSRGVNGVNEVVRWLSRENPDLERRTYKSHPNWPQAAALLRDVFPTPDGLLPLATIADCRTDTVLAIARSMWNDRDFSAMPILADALQDAGCDRADVLDHCRDANQPHCRGCWVLDAILSPVLAPPA